MDRRSFIVGGAALWAALAAQPAAAQPAGWVLLGSRTVNWAAGRDSIMVRAMGPISSLSFRTRGGEVFITGVEVSFTRGGQERSPVNMRVRPNARTSVVRLRTPNNGIRRVDYSYRRVSSRGPTMRTTIEVFGRR